MKEVVELAGAEEIRSLVATLHLRNSIEELISDYCLGIGEAEGAADLAIQFLLYYQGEMTDEAICTWLKELCVPFSVEMVTGNALRAGIWHVIENGGDGKDNMPFRDLIPTLDEARELVEEDISHCKAKMIASPDKWLNPVSRKAEIFTRLFAYGEDRARGIKTALLRDRKAKVLMSTPGAENLPESARLRRSIFDVLDDPKKSKAAALIRKMRRKKASIEEIRVAVRKVLDAA